MRKRQEMTENAFQAVLTHFNHRMERICEVAMPIIKQVYENQGMMYERILVPITDGHRIYNIACNLKEAYETECKSVVKEFEKQKDPLLIFKLESAKLFDSMVNDMFNRQVTILTRAQIPELQNQQVKEAAPEQHTDRNQYTENRQQEQQEEQLVDQGQKAAAQNDTRAQQPRTPIIKDKLPGRNDPCPCGSGKKFKNCHGRGLRRDHRLRHRFAHRERWRPAGLGG